ncbi:hypothetical protein GCM10009623_31030 [Nocardioides aestuarii]|uniref:Uncharacterized protein n=1 Tax=Nocardioides aestuarii TaxID=252231 RepID=A0ABW4TS18_9ACTN
MSCWRPLLSVLAQVAVVGVGCAVADHGGLDGPGGWPYLLGFVLLTVFYASWPLGITLLTGIVAAVASEEATLRGAVVLGAVVAGVSGALGAAFGLVWLVVPPAHAAELVVGSSLLLGGVVALAPAVTLLRARRRA